jgi:3-phosphoshikimate 1-carboxyvinyltransferase
MSEDIKATINCLETLGGKFSIRNSYINVTPIPLDIKSLQKINRSKDETILDCGESGSTLRFLLPLTTILRTTFKVTGHGRLPERPINKLLDELTAHGCIFSNNRLPLIGSGQLLPGVYELPGNVTSQYISGLLFALPLLSDNSSINIIGEIQSISYIEMTLRTLRQYGIHVTSGVNSFSVPGRQTYTSQFTNYVENDWSNAAFWLCAGAFSESEIVVNGLNSNSAQPDKNIVDLLELIGTYVTVNDSPSIIKTRDVVGESISIKPNKLNAIEFDASQSPDLVPILAVVLSVCKGQSIIRNASRLRLKESDRLKAISENLNKLGARIKETEDELIIDGVECLKGGTVDGFNDHRIVMAMAIASAISTGDIIINDSEAVEKSYKRFWDDFEELGGKFDVI